MEALKLAHLEFGHGKALFEPLGMRCALGEITAVLGGNGLGKSTLLHTVCGLILPLAGDLCRAESAGFVPQSFMPHFAYSALDIVIMGRVGAVKFLRMPSRHDRRMAVEALHKLDIRDLAATPYSELSGGQKQLVLVARALAAEHRFLVLDEPTAALDLKNQLKVLRLVRHLAKTEGLSVLFSTHEPAHAMLIADYTLLLLPGKKWLYGANSEVLTEANLFAAYGVEMKYVAATHANKAYQSLLPIFDI